MSYNPFNPYGVPTNETPVVAQGPIVPGGTAIFIDSNTITSGGAPGGGDVNGPGSSVINNIVSWSNTAGTLIGDSGLSTTNLVTASGSHTTAHLATWGSANTLVDGGIVPLGDVVGPVSSTSGDIAIFNNSSGTLIADSTIPISTIATVSGSHTTTHLAAWGSGNTLVDGGVISSGTVIGPGSSTVGDVVTFNNTSGTLVADSSIPAANLTTVSGSHTTGNLATWGAGNTLVDGGVPSAGSVTSVTGTAPIVSSGGTTPAISLAASGVTAGSYTFLNATVTTPGLISAASSGLSGTLTSGNVTSASSASQITDSGIPSTSIVTAITGTTGDITATPTTTTSTSYVLDLATVSSVTPGTFTNPIVQVDAKGRVTGISSGVAVQEVFGSYSLTGTTSPTSSQTITVATAGTNVQVPLPAGCTIDSTGSYLASNTVTPGVAGTYLVSAEIYMTTPASNVLGTLTIYVSGAAVTSGSGLSNTSSALSISIPSFAIGISSSDTLTVQFTANTTGAYIFYQNPFVSSSQGLGAYFLFINPTGGSGSGTVTTVDGTAGNITTTNPVGPVVTVNLATVGTAGIYTYPSVFQTDAYGRVISAAVGTAPVTETAIVTGNLPKSTGTNVLGDTGIVATSVATSETSTGGTIALTNAGTNTVNFEVAHTAVTPGSYGYISGLTVDATGRLTSVTSAGSTPPSVVGSLVSGNIVEAAGANSIQDSGITASHVATSETSSGSTITITGSGTNTVNFDLPNRVVAGTYNNITLNAQGVATAAGTIANVTPGSAHVTGAVAYWLSGAANVLQGASYLQSAVCVSETSTGSTIALTNAGTNTVNFEVAHTTVTPGSYGFISGLTVDATGRLTSVTSAGSAPASVVGSLVTGNLVDAAGTSSIQDSGLVAANIVSASGPIVSGDVAIWSSTTNTILDSGINQGNLTLGPLTSVVGDVPSFSNTTGHIQDSGVLATALATASGSHTSGHLVTWGSGNTLTDGGGTTGGTVTSISAVSGQTVCTPNPITATGTIGLATTAVTPGTYGYTSSMTVDAYGRLTSVISAGSAPVTSVTGTTGDISSTGGTAPVLDLVNTTVTPGSYTAANITVDAKGRITSVSNGGGSSAAITGFYNVTSGNFSGSPSQVTGLTANLDPYSMLSSGNIIVPSAGIYEVVVGVPCHSLGGSTFQGFIYKNGVQAGVLTSFNIGTETTTYVLMGGVVQISCVATDALSLWVDTTTFPIQLSTGTTVNGGYVSVKLLGSVGGIGGNTTSTSLVTGNIPKASGANSLVDSGIAATSLVTGVTGTSPVVSSGGTTPAISLAASGVTAGSYTSTNLTVDSLGRITAAANGSGGGGNTTSTSLVSGNLTKANGANSIIDSGIAAANVVQTSGTNTTSHYATWNGADTVTTGGLALSGFTTSTNVNVTGFNAVPVPSIDLGASGVTAGSYTSTNLTVDAEGRITAASNGSGGSTAVTGFYNIPTATSPSTSVSVPAQIVTAVTLDPNSMWQSGGAIKVPTAGTYEIIVGLPINGAPPGYLGYVYKNGALYSYLNSDDYAASDQSTMVGVSQMVCAVNDLISIWIANASGGSVILSRGAAGPNLGYMSVKKIA